MSDGEARAAAPLQPSRRSPSTTKGAVTISIDLELAWGRWDGLERRDIEHVERLERPIVGRLIKIFDRHEIPVTWAIVAALLDQASAKGRPGGEHLWYAPDLIEKITEASVKHDIGSHGGRHKYFDTMSPDEANEELTFARSIHQNHGLAFDSFVYPRNKVAKTKLLQRHGIRVYRGTEHAWHQRIRDRSVIAGRLANLVDKMTPTAPETVLPESNGHLVSLPGSMLLFGRSGIRRIVPSHVLRRKLHRGVAVAERSGRVFHLWFHPSNFWQDCEAQFTILEDFVREVAGLRNRGRIDIKPMAEFA